MAGVCSGRRFTLCVAALVAALAPSRSVFAQTIMLGDHIVRRADRPSQLRPTVINHDDCIAGDSGDSLTLTLVTSDIGGLALEVWAGISAECGYFAHNAVLNPSVCWRLARFDAVPNAVSINVRDIIPHVGFDTGSADICETPGNLGLGVGSAYFLLTRGNTQVGPTASLTVTFDLQAPEPPLAQTLTAADASLTLSWSPTESLSLVANQVYCEPAAPEGCAAPSLVVGARPAIPPTAQAGADETRAQVRGLENQRRYACGVASLDGAGNLGTLSNLLCETPIPIAEDPNSLGPEISGRCGFGRAASPSSAVALGLAALSLCGRRRNATQPKRPSR